MGRLRECNRALVLLAVLSLVSLAARSALLGEPCRGPCRSASSHVLIFDETYYVNAARVIAGVRPPPGAPYAQAPSGDDANSEHPQLAKLIMAGSIELFGDGPLAWRLGSLVFGSLAILGLYALVRAGGGGARLALVAAALLALDNLQLVHGRIATLDVFVLAAMLWGAALFLRGRVLAAGVMIGVGACFKLVDPYVVLVLALYEALRLARAQSGARAVRAALSRLGACALTALGMFVGLLAVLDRIAPPFDATAGKAVGGGVFGHIGHMLSYAASQASPGGPKGIASYPWQWFVDYLPITYLNINPARPAPGFSAVHPASHFLGVISPVILVAALPGLALAGVHLARDHGRGPDGDLDLLSVAWVLGTWVPFELLSLIWNRTSYLYYMVIVLPGMYMAGALLLDRFAQRRRLIALWWLAALAAVVVMYPFTPLP